MQESDQETRPRSHGEEETSNIIKIPLKKLMENQGLLTIITLGHVAHGKSTLVRGITHIKTQKHKAELERNITINLGYANAKIYYNSITKEIKSIASSQTESGDGWHLLQHISVIDTPGHESLMSTMISGTHNFDVAFLMIAGNDKVMPQSQTYEHLLALAASKKTLDLGLILHNKLDLINREEALENRRKIHEFIEGSPASSLRLMPISAQLGTNMSQVLRYLGSLSPRDLGISQNTESVSAATPQGVNKPSQLVIIRSFNVNKPNVELEGLEGGVIGGSLKCGHLKVGDILEIRPGIVANIGSEWNVTPLLARVTSLFSETRKVDLAVAGGLLGIGLSLDSGLTKSNKLVGQIASKIGHGPGVIHELTISYRRISRPLTESNIKEKVADNDNANDNGGNKKNNMTENKVTKNIEVKAEKKEKPEKKTEKQMETRKEKADEKEKEKDKDNEGSTLNKGERVKVCIHAVSAHGIVTKVNKKEATIKLEIPISFFNDDNIVIMRTVKNRWQLSGTGKLVSAAFVTNMNLPSNYDTFLNEDKEKTSRVEIIEDEDLNSLRKELGDTITENTYDKLLSNIYPESTASSNSNTEKTSDRMEITAPIVKPHNRITLWQNFKSVSDTLQKGYPDPNNEKTVLQGTLIDCQTHFLQFLSEELATSNSVNAKGELLINGKFRDNNVEKVIRNYLRQYRTCQNCSKVNSYLYKNRNHLIMLFCNNCGSERAI